MSVFRAFCASCLLVGLAGLLFGGCAEFQEIKGKTYPESAQLNFEEGQRQLEAENYEIAQKYFGLVSSTYAFSQYNILAELYLGETLLKRELYAEAISAFKSFQRNHPTHPCTSFAQFRTAEAYYRQLPEDWWFMPPTFERDQDQTEKALREFEVVIEGEDAYDYHFPAAYKPAKIRVCEGRSYEQTRAILYTAKQRIGTCRARLISREIYVSDYYAKRDKPLGSIGRLEPLLQRYPDQLKEAGVVRRLGRAYRAAHMYRKARALWSYVQLSELARRMPGEAAKELATIDKEEKNYLAAEAKAAPAREAKKRREAAFRAAHNLAPVDPDPDPNVDDSLPFLAPESPKQTDPEKPVPDEP